MSYLWNSPHAHCYKNKILRSSHSPPPKPITNPFWEKEEEVPSRLIRLGERRLDLFGRLCGERTRGCGRVHRHIISPDFALIWPYFLFFWTRARACHVSCAADSGSWAFIIILAPTSHHFPIEQTIFWCWNFLKRIASVGWKLSPIKTYTQAEIVNEFEGIFKLTAQVLVTKPNAAYTWREVVGRRKF
jgi:hypothetical protein